MVIHVPMYLCSYGVGYHLTVVKEPNCDSETITSVVERTVSGAKMITDVAAELSFVLPSQSSSQFSDLFDLLECQSNRVCSVRIMHVRRTIVAN